MRETMKPLPLAQSTSLNLQNTQYLQNTYPQLQSDNEANPVKPLPNGNNWPNNNEQTSGCSDSSKFHDENSQTPLPPHIRMLAPHLRAKEKARWEASKREAADAAEEKKRQEKQRQDELLMLKGVVTEKQAGHNARWANLVSREMNKKAADVNSSPAPTTAKPKEATLSAKRWVVAGEDIEQLKDGRTVSTARLRLVTDDNPSVSVPAPKKEDVVRVTGEIDKSPLPSARKEWLTPSPALDNTEKFQPVQPVAPSSTNTPSSPLVKDNGSGSASGSGSEGHHNDHGGGGVPLTWDGSAQKQTAADDVQLIADLDAPSPEWEDKNNIQNTPASCGVPWSQSQWSDPKADFSDANWATKVDNKTDKGKDIQRDDVQPDKNALPVSSLPPVKEA
ncbi:hypothetical protein SBRCBS47491_009551 [Sporothrix bragantina]|uniref:Uncharacterized protein n=1 Tax=Sporothrix bragantina TaxID=671064 RepID=A0ABP0CVN5_9PEZI